LNLLLLQLLLVLVLELLLLLLSAVGGESRPHPQIIEGGSRDDGRALEDRGPLCKRGQAILWSNVYIQKWSICQIKFFWEETAAERDQFE
jgi:hypothetical protein